MKTNFKLTGGFDSGEFSGITLVPGGTDSGETAGITLAIGADRFLDCAQAGIENVTLRGNAYTMKFLVN